jgi:hypothetical protein
VVEGGRARIRGDHGERTLAAPGVQMGFHEGWGKALDQLVEHVKSL